MFVERYEVTIATDGSGAGTGFTPIVQGEIRAIRYLADGSTPYDNTADFTITGDVSGLAVLTVTNESASNTYYPRAATVTVANAASLYAAAGTAVNDRIPMSGERLKIVVAQGGATKTGKFHVWIG